MLLSATAVNTVAQLPNEFQQVDLLTGLSNATTIRFAPDGRIFILDRYGELIIYKTDTQTSVSAGTIPVFHEFEEGLLGIAFDPDFITNNYIYLHYAVLGQSTNRVSRFTMNGDFLDLSSETVVVEWSTQRITSFHSGGDMAFDSQGNLYIAVGDNAYYSDAYGSHNETDISATTEKSSSNTNDMRGKILRITPQADGSYTIPAGNLFPAGTPNTLPEIYVMGARNPYRIFVDKENTDWLFWGEVGPDANAASALGPEGLDEMNLTKASGNYGWPYFSGIDNDAYQVAYRTPSPFYNDPAAPENTSTWNTGATVLPPAQPAWLEFFHECYFAGPRYYYDGALTDDQRFPVEFDEIFFYYDFNSSKIWAVEMDAQGNIISNDLFAPAVFTSKSDGFIDMEFGPDGKMYILAYGSGCCPQNVGTGKLLRVDYTGITTNAPPTVMISADPTSGSLPLTVNFSSAGTSDPNGDSPLTYEWDFDGDGNVDSNTENPTYVYNDAGIFNVQLRVDDGNGGIGVNNVTIYAGNTAATFFYNSPPDGGFMDWGDDVSIDLVVSDIEDGSTGSGIDCNDINVVPALGHLNHFHDLATMTGCPQNFNLGYDGHDITGEMDLFYVLNANYTDQGGLTAFDQILLHPKRMEAEFYYEASEGVNIIANNDPWGGGSGAVRVSHGDYLVYPGRNLINIDEVRYRTSSESIGGVIELRLDSIDGQLLSSVQVPVTQSFSNWVDYEVPIEDPGDKHDLYFVFVNNPGDLNMFDLNWIEFVGAGISAGSATPEVQTVEAVTPTIVAVQYTEPIDEAYAERVEIYTITNGIDVLGAYLQPDEKTVYLDVTQLSNGVDYSLDIAGAMQFPISYEGCGKVPFPVQWSEQIIDDELPYRSVYILPQQDIDGDGFKDIVTGSWWYKNPGSINGNWTQRLIGAPFNNVAWIHDFDGDGDYDLFGSQGQYESADLVWAENDGSGNFTIHTNIPSGTSTFGEIFIAGVAGGVFQDGGPYQMALSWNGGEDGSSQVQMVTVPADPVNNNWTIENLHPTSTGEAITAGDIDDDGDLDLFMAAHWFRNDGGTWTFFSTGITFNTLFDRSTLADIDGDGDLDGVAGQIGNNQEVAWFEAPDDPTQSWSKFTIDPSIDGTLSLAVEDMDFDGDPDVIVAEWRGAHKIFGFENDLNVSGGWIKYTLDDGGPLDHHDGAQMVDMDNDGDLDFMTIGWNSIIPRIFENKSSASNCAPILVNPGNQQFEEQDMVSLQIIASDPNIDDELTYTITGLPPSLTFDENTGLISGAITISSGDYAVVVTVTDGVQVVKESFLIQIGLVTGTPDTPNISDAKVFPNPTTNEATLEVYLSSGEEVNIEVVDVIGKTYDFGKVQFSSGRNLQTLNVSSLNNGVYYLRLISISSRNEGVKFVVDK